MKNKDKYTLVNPKNGKHYDTNDKRFYDDNWERTKDSKNYLEQIVGNNPEKFEGFNIVKND